MAKFKVKANDAKNPVHPKHFTPKQFRLKGKIQENDFCAKAQTLTSATVNIRNKMVPVILTPVSKNK